MRTLINMRQTTPNIGNALIALGHECLLRSVFGDELNLVTMNSAGTDGGFTPKGVYEMNQLADGLIVGLGNIFENGALTIDPFALESLTVPMLVLGASSGRVYAADGQLVQRTDSLPPEQIALLRRIAGEFLVRDESTQNYLASMGLKGIGVSGCPTLFLGEIVSSLPQDTTTNGSVLISLRNPQRMSIPYRAQGRVWEDVRGLIEHFRQRGDDVRLLCHDIQDLSFAHGFPDVPLLYSEDPRRVLAWLRGASLNITFRLHAFLPCLAIGTPSINLSYDERAKSLIKTVGMSEWDIDYIQSENAVDQIRERMDNLDRFHDLVEQAQPKWEKFRSVSTDSLVRLAERIDGRRLAAVA